MYIGPYKIKNNIFLAPMAGVADKPFRIICSKLGAGLTYAEMMSANPDTWRTVKSKLRSSHSDELGLKVIQILGDDPFNMAESAKMNVDNGAQIVDINMGCPAKKVNKKNAGSSLLQYPDLVAKILNSVVKSVSVPVTLKIRTGWDTENRNYSLIARIAEDNGIQALTVHGRTRNCLFKGNAEYDSIKEIKQLISIPIIANGDITSPNKAQNVLEYTNADAIMLGRGTLGNPWIFNEICTFLNKDVTNNKISYKDKCKIMLEHIESIYDFYGINKGCFIARKHINWYIKYINQHSKHKEIYAMEFIKKINNIDNAKLQLELFNAYIELNLNIMEKQQ